MTKSFKRASARKASKVTIIDATNTSTDQVTRATLITHRPPAFIPITEEEAKQWSSYSEANKPTRQSNFSLVKLILAIIVSSLAIAEYIGLYVMMEMIDPLNIIERVGIAIGGVLLAYLVYRLVIHYLDD
jgi:hypothetical protein